MTLNYSVEKKHFHAFQIFHFHNSQPVIVLFLLVIVATFVNAFAKLNAQNQSGTHETYAHSLLAGALALVLLRLSMTLFVVWKSNSFLSSDRTPLGDFQLTFDDNNIIETSDVFTKEFNFSLVHCLIYRKKCLFVYVGKTNAILIPVSAFNNSVDAVAFLDLIYIRTEKKLRRSDYSNFILAVKENEPQHNS